MLCPFHMQRTLLTVALQRTFADEHTLLAYPNSANTNRTHTILFTRHGLPVQNLSFFVASLPPPRDPPTLIRECSLVRATVKLQRAAGAMVGGGNNENTS